MYLVERLIGIGTYTLALVVTCILLAYSNARPKAILRGYTFLLSVMAFFYVPHVNADLYRIFETVREFAFWQMEDFFPLVVRTSTTPAAALLYWLVGKTGEARLLPAVTCLICYTCLFHIIADSAVRTAANRRDLAAAMFFFMATGNYMMLISNIRTMLSIALILYCLYRETVEKKSNILDGILYIIAIFLHNLGAVLVAARLLLALADRKLPLKKRVCALLCLVLCGVIGLTVFRNVAEAILLKFRDYVSGGHYFYGWEYLLACMTGAVSFWGLRAYKKCSRPLCPEYGQAARLLGLCLLGALFFCFEFTVFHRLLTFVAPALTAALLLPVLRDAGDRGVRNARPWVVLISAGMLLVACARGSLSSLKFFVL